MPPHPVKLAYRQKNAGRAKSKSEQGARIENAGFGCLFFWHCDLPVEMRPGNALAFPNCRFVGSVSGMT